MFYCRPKETMNKFWSSGLAALFLVTVFVVYREWFSFNLITSGDFWPFFKSMYNSRSLPLSAWDFNHMYGLGGFTGPFLWIHANLSTPITLFGRLLNLPWPIVERFGNIYPFLILSFLSPFLLANHLFKSRHLALFSSSIYALNTYIFMIVGGGQFAGVGMGYAFIPLVVLMFLKTISEKELKTNALLLGLVFGIQLVYDIRFGFMTTVIILLAALFHIRKIMNVRMLVAFGFAGVIALLLNAFWILPSILVHQNPFEVLGSEYRSTEAVKFFSFAKFENTIALLHPNWPHNIFGKVGFMKEEFLLIPVLAFSSLFYITKEKKNICAFLLIGLVGIFLAKGANEPFGFVYTFFFEYIPGFQLFRDPTKWYSLIALSFSILIPWFVLNTYNKLKESKILHVPVVSIRNSNKTFNLQNIFVLTVLGCLVILIKPAWSGELGGAFKSVSIPQDYLELEKVLSSDNEFYRTLWIPSYQRFSYYSTNHPSIPAVGFLKANDIFDVLRILKQQETEELIDKSSVKFIIVPVDSEKEIFLTDRAYDNGKRIEIIKALENTPWLERVSGYKELAVFENVGYQKHFWSARGLSNINSKQVTPTRFTVTAYNGVKNEKIVFSETYDPNWVALTSRNKIQSAKYEGFNSFVLPEAGTYEFEVTYKPQKIVDIASFVSISTFIFLIFVVLYSMLLRKKK